jgi:uncharacterized protein YndB with AHSA1/START domain
MSTQATDLAVRKTVTVKAPLEHAFNVFTEGIATWWPLDKHSLKQEDADDVVFEARLGGRVYESWQGGEENWGEVLVWEPPRRIVFSWHPGYAPKEATEIEVRFSEEGDGTKVELEHRGWERLGDRGKEARTGYDSGWTGVLERYAEVASK